MTIINYVCVIRCNLSLIMAKDVFISKTFTELKNILKPHIEMSLFGFIIKIKG